MLRRTLMWLVKGRAGQRGLDAALAFASGYGASVAALSLREPAALPAVLDEAVTACGASARLAGDPNAWQRPTDRRMDAVDMQMEQVFRSACAARHVSCAWRSITGSPLFELPRATRAFDLAVVGREGAGAEADAAAAELVRRGACSVLVVTDELPRIETIGVAYDGSRAADRALAAAADIAVHWKGGPPAVSVISVDPGSGTAGAALRDAQAYLDAYDLKSDVRLLKGATVPALLESLAERPVDLFLMGVHGHSLLHDLFVGSSTEGVLEKYRGALLVCR